MVGSSARLRPWLPALLWAGVIFGLSSISGAQIPGVPLPSADKIAHLGVYGIFGILCFRGLRATTNLSPRGLILAGSMIAFGYGVSDEVHQIFVPGRSSEVGDLLADVVGGALGCLVARWFHGSRWFHGRGKGA